LFKIIKFILCFCRINWPTNNKQNPTYGNQKHIIQYLYVQNKSYSAHVILNRGFHNINIKINLPNKSIASGNIVFRMRRATTQPSFCIQLKPITHTEVFASSWWLPSVRSGSFIVFGVRRRSDLPCKITSPSVYP